MAGVKISNLPAAIALTGTEVLPAVQGTTTSKVSVTQLFTNPLGLTGGALLQDMTVGRGNGAIATNTALGKNALGVNTSGSFGTAVGESALTSNTTGTANSALGNSALNYNNIGAYNLAAGASAMYYNTTGNSNTAVGRASLQNNTTGSSNIALGADSGTALTTGSSNTILGSIAGTAGLSSTVIVAAGTTERLRITSAGGVSFGATGTAYGTSGQVLTSAGNATPVWASATPTSSPTLDSVFVNNNVDLWTVNGASGPPDKFTMVSGTAERLQVTPPTTQLSIWPANLTSTSIKYTQASSTLANSLRAVPSNQPWPNTETLSVLVGLYMPNIANLVMRVYRDFNGSTLALGDAATDGNWNTVQASFSITAGQTNWGLLISIIDTTTGLPVSSAVCYVGGVNIVRGAIPPQTLSDSAARRAYVATSVTYAPPFQGCRAFIAGTGKWYMAADQSAPGDWIILN